MLFYLSLDVVADNYGIASRLGAKWPLSSVGSNMIVILKVPYFFNGFLLRLVLTLELGAKLVIYA